MIYAFTILHNFICVQSSKKKDIFEQTDPAGTNKSGIQELQATIYTKIMVMNIKWDIIVEHMWIDYQRYITYEGL